MHTICAPHPAGRPSLSAGTKQQHAQNDSVLFQKTSCRPWCVDWQDTFTYRVKGVRVLPVPGVVVDLQAGRHVPSSQHWGAHLDWHIVRPAHDASLPGREHDQLPASGEQVNPAASVEMGPSCER